MDIHTYKPRHICMYKNNLLRPDIMLDAPWLITNYKMLKARYKGLDRTQQMIFVGPYIHICICIYVSEEKVYIQKHKHILYFVH